MTTPTHRDFAARRKASQEAITRDFLTFIDEESLAAAAQALNAAQEEAAHGAPTADTLMRVAEATIAAARILDAAAKACAAQAVDAGNPLRDAARRLRVGTATITQNDETVVTTPEDAWWIPEITYQPTEETEEADADTEVTPLQQDNQPAPAPSPEIGAETPAPVADGSGQSNPQFPTSASPHAF